MPRKTFTYKNQEITVVWEPGRCIHSGICFKGLPEVFDPRRRPWIQLERSETGQISQQVSKCPSGALSFFFHETKATPGDEQGQ